MPKVPYHRILAVLLLSAGLNTARLVEAPTPGHNPGVFSLYRQEPQKSRARQTQPGIRQTSTETGESTESVKG